MRARRLAFCRRCNGETSQQYLSTEQEGVELWRCQCGSTLMSILDIPDVDGFAISIAEAWMRRSLIVSTEVEREEVHAEARVSLWLAFTRYSPERGVAFRSYAAWKTGALLTDWIRGQRGRTYGSDRSGLKPHAGAVSLDAPADSVDDPGTSRLDGIVSPFSRDPADDSSADLARALELGSRRQPREERSVGGTTYARTA